MLTFRGFEPAFGEVFALNRPDTKTSCSVARRVGERVVVPDVLTNAVKFTPNGGRIDVRLDRADGQAEVTVRDTGQGIPPDFLPYVFERFRQQDATASRKHGGLGLGLSIVRYLTEAHGGTVSVSSPGEGGGATFALRLPLSNARHEGARAAAPAQAPPSLHGVQVLVVDDEADACELLAMVLEAWGPK